MSDASGRVAQMSAREKRVLLSELLRKKAGKTNSVYPLSYPQQGLWLLDQIEPIPANNLIVAFRLTGPLNLSALEQSLNEILRRHEVLRSTVLLVGGEPYQVVAPVLRLALPVVDLSELSQTEREGKIHRQATEEAQAPFDLKRGPLLRVCLLRLDDREHIMLLTIHHLIFDFWSGVILLDELSVLYKAFTEGTLSPLTEGAYQYRDFVRWQQLPLQGEVLESQCSYWKEKLASPRPVLDLPTDYPHPKIQSLCGNHHFFELSPGLYESLKHLSRKEGVTLFMTLLAAFKVLVFRWSGQTDIVIGSPIMGRDQFHTERMIGCFANVVVLRTDLSGDLPFRELLGRVRQVALEAYTHSRVPYAKLVMEIGRPERQAGYAPLVQVMFDFMKAPIGTMELSGGLEVSPVDVERGVVYLDIFLMMTESPGGVRGSLGYRSDLFTSDTIANVVGTYCTILEQCVDDPQTRLSHFQLRGTLLPGSRRTGLHENNLAMAITSTFTPPRTRTEELLTGVWGEVLGLKQVGVHDNFFELGGDSFLIAELISRLREARQIELPPRCVFEAPTVAALAEVLDAMDHAGSSLAVIVPDLKAEAALDSTIHPIGAPVQRVAEPTSIFLTGATGFLGAYVLHELLQQTRADIYCLVRSTDVEEGRKRLQGHLESYALWDSYLGSRVIPVVGDLAQPHLGLSREKFQLMASEIDIIYHTGAQVNFINPYSALKATNVLGTQEILKLATHGKTKPVHYISTLGVFYAGSYSGSKVVREYDDPDDCEGLALGYTQSKWVAEKLMTIARDRGLPVFVYRPAVIIGDSQKGIWNVSDIMCRLIRAFIQLESAPDLDATLDLTPVDYVSRAIVYLSRQKGSPGKTFHITNPKPLHWGQLIDFVRSFGYPLQKVSFAQWQAELKNRHDGFDKNALYPLLSLFYEVLFAGRRSVEGTPVPTRMPEFDCQNTLEGLAGTPIICPQIDAELIGTYLGYLTRCGFLNSPAHRS